MHKLPCHQGRQEDGRLKGGKITPLLPVLVTEQRILPKKGGLGEGQAVENVAVAARYGARERSLSGSRTLFALFGQ